VSIFFRPSPPMSSLEARLKAQTGGKAPEGVKELDLDGCNNPDLALLAPYAKLAVLSLNNCALASLDALPDLPELQLLNLCDNRLTGGLDRLGQMTGLRALALANNRLKDLDALAPLKALKELDELELFANPLTEAATYRSDVFGLFPGLKMLDGKDKDGNEVDDDEEDEEDEEDDDEEDESGEENLPPAKRRKSAVNGTAAGHSDDFPGTAGLLGDGGEDADEPPDAPNYDPAADAEASDDDDGDEDAGEDN